MNYNKTQTLSVLFRYASPGFRSNVDTKTSLMSTCKINVSWKTQKDGRLKILSIFIWWKTQTMIFKVPITLGPSFSLSQEQYN